MSKNKNKPHQPHDIFFRKSMEQPSVAVDLLKSYLPKGILSRINLSTLKQQKESFIEKDIGSGTVDCLYQVELISNNNKSNSPNIEVGYVYLILEQQTKVDRFMGFRLIKYIVSIMEYHRKKYKDDRYLPFICPLVLYTGLGSYNAPTNLLDLFRDKELARMMITQFFQLIDINNIEDEEMRRHLYAGAMMYIYKHRVNRAIADRIELIKDNLSIIIKEIGIEYPSVMLEYLISTGEADKEQTEKLIDIFIELASDEEDKEKIMTIADNLRQEGEQRGIEKGMLQGMQKGIQQGIQQGMQQGMQKGIEATAAKMLKEGCNISLIAKVTGLTTDQLVRIKAELQ